METDMIRQIKEELARMDGADEGTDEFHKLTREAKTRCLEKMLERAQERDRLTKPEIFVSFTGEAGQEIMLQVMRKINSTRAPGTSGNFHASSGMDQRGDGQLEVLNHIIGRMKTCCLFVGILTREWEMAAKEVPDRYGPGGWALLETGMALSLGLRVIFFIDKGINPNFWRLYLGQVRHVQFDPLSYTGAVGSLMNRIEETYKGLRKQNSEKSA